MSSENATGNAETVKRFRRSEKDTGSPEIQIALLTRRLEVLTEHFKKHTQDLHSQRGMMRMIAHRKGLLQYLKEEDAERYKTVINTLGLRK